LPTEFPIKHVAKPLIPDGSTQYVEFAVVAAHDTPAEVHPYDFRDLIDGEDLKRQDLVFWYSATSHQSHDAFFTHGGFFGPIGEADLGVAMTGPAAAGQEQNVTFTIDVTNHGPSFATNVTLRDVWSLPETAFVSAGSSSQCASGGFQQVLCDLGDIVPGKTVTLTIVLHLLSFSGDPLVAIANARGDRKDPQSQNDRTRSITQVVP